MAALNGTTPQQLYDFFEELLGDSGELPEACVYEVEGGTGDHPGKPAEVQRDRQLYGGCDSEE